MVGLGFVSINPEYLTTSCCFGGGSRADAVKATEAIGVLGNHSRVLDKSCMLARTRRTEAMPT